MMKSQKFSIPLNTPFIFTYNSKKSSETLMNKAGFFIRKNIKLTNNFIEVYRVNKSVFLEKGACWFFLTIGSGIYLRLENTNYFIGSRKEIKGWNEINPWKSMKNRKIVTFINTKDGWFSKIGLIEIVSRLKKRNIKANDAKLPLFRYGLEYKQNYDKITHCMI